MVGLANVLNFDAGVSGIIVIVMGIVLASSTDESEVWLKFESEVCVVIGCKGSNPSITWFPGELQYVTSSFGILTTTLHT